MILYSNLINDTSIIFIINKKTYFTDFIILYDIIYIYILHDFILKMNYNVIKIN